MFFPSSLQRFVGVLKFAAGLLMPTFATMDEAPRTLAELPMGNTAVIKGFTDNALALKFIELGCLPGERITLQYIAPLGCPFAYEVNGTLLSIRKSEAKSVLID